MKRVLIFSTNYFPNVGGAEVAIKEITDRVSDIEFDLITIRFSRKVPAKERIGNVTVHRVGIGSGFAFFDKLLSPFLGAWKAFQLDKKQRVDLAWCMMVTFTSGSPYILNLIRPWKPIRIVLTLQEGDSEEHLTRRHLYLNGLSWKLALSRANVLTVISTYLEKRARRLGYIGLIELVPNGVEFEKYSTTPPNEILQEYLSDVNKKEGDVLLVTVSRLVKKNAVDDIIRSLRHLPNNVRLLVIGIGPDERQLKVLVKEENVEDRVLFLGWEDHDWMIPYLHISDIFIRPSLSEGFGISFVEAMAAGLPVIATQEGGIADFLFDRKRNPDKEPTGWAVDKDSPQQIAEAVKDILENPAIVGETVSNSKKLVSLKYDWNLIARDMKEKVFTPLL